MSNLISIETYKPIIQFNKAKYQSYIDDMDKFDLMDEMIRFQEERINDQELSIEQILKGQVLFKALIDNSVSKAMLDLCQTYLRHLGHELKYYLKSQVS